MKWRYCKTDEERAWRKREAVRRYNSSARGKAARRNYMRNLRDNHGYKK